MAAMVALHCKMASLGLSSNVFFGERPLLSLSSPSSNSFQKPCLIRMKIKRWERKEVKPNSLPILQKMHVRVGDTVKVISGHDKGKVGDITRVYKHNSNVLVKDVNVKTKHVKGKQQGEAGQIIQIEAPIHSSNVMLYSKTQKVASRVGHKVLEDGRKVRYLLKTGEILDSSAKWNDIIKKGKEREKKD